MDCTSGFYLFTGHPSISFSELGYREGFVLPTTLSTWSSSLLSPCTAGFRGMIGSASRPTRPSHVHLHLTPSPVLWCSWHWVTPKTKCVCTVGPGGEAHILLAPYYSFHASHGYFYSTRHPSLKLMPPTDTALAPPSIFLGHFSMFIEDFSTWLPVFLSGLASSVIQGDVTVAQGL